MPLLLLVSVFNRYHACLGTVTVGVISISKNSHYNRTFGIVEVTVCGIQKFQVFLRLSRFIELSGITGRTAVSVYFESYLTVEHICYKKIYKH